MNKDNWKELFPKENIYFEVDNGILYNSDILEHLRLFSDNSVDLIVTSPPYDNLRYYGANNENEFEKIWNWDKFTKSAKEMYRVLKDGGVLVWVVGDATINGSETGNSFRQALYFKDECGFNLHDTMIYEKRSFSNPSKVRYHQVFEYMFILSKGKPKTFNPIKDRKNKYAGETNWGTNTIRQKDGTLKQRSKVTVSDYSMRFNIWQYAVGAGVAQKDKIAYKHPATFPEQLAYDHIISWSNEGDIVLDPFMGSGTTAKQCEKLNRKWIGIEINKEYCDIIKERITFIIKQRKLF